MAISVKLHHPLSPGDSLILTGAIRSLHNQYPGEYRVAVQCTAGEAIFANNPDVVPVSEMPNPDKHGRVHYDEIHRCNQEPIHFLEAMTQGVSFVVERPIRTTVNRPFLFLSDAERQWDGVLKELSPKPCKFGLIVSGGKSDYTVKHLGRTITQETVNHFKGKIPFVQIGEKPEQHPALKGVIDLRGKTDVRELIRLAYHSAFGVGGITFLLHIYAALERPYVAVLGGREPRSWITYPTQVEISSAGCLPCCQTSSCWASRVVELPDGDNNNRRLCALPIRMAGGDVVPKCIAMPGSRSIIQAIEQLYYGGVLR